MGMMMRAAGALLATAAMVTTAEAAACVASQDMAAMRMAATQQQLMVAAFSCHEIRNYNRFVLEHRPELIASDARLKAFFTQRSGRGEAGYHLFKTELANAASLRSVRDGDNFCADAGDTFAWALEADTLSRTISELPMTIAAAYRPCEPDGGRDARDGGPARLAYRPGGHHAALDDRDDEDAAPPPPAPRGRRHHQVDLGEDL